MMQGDPRMILGPGGSRLQFIGGQPLMDEGLENLVMISLFTRPGWCGNVLLRTPVGTDFEEACNQPITRQSLNQIRNAAERALKLKVLGRVIVDVVNPSGSRLEVRISINSTLSALLSREGGRWAFQALSPAYRKVI